MARKPKQPDPHVDAETDTRARADGGPASTLTRLEAEVMRVVWDLAPDPVRVRDVLDQLNAARRRPFAYNTIQTVVTILRDKGVVRQVGDRGRAHLFEACVSRNDASRHMVRDLAERMFGGNVQPLLHHLIDDGELDDAQLQQLRDWVDERLEDGGSAT